MSARAWPIGVRLARPDDRGAVLRFASTTWDGWDYIPEVWDDWVVPSSGIALVATVQAPLNGDEPRDAEGAPLTVGQPIALTRVVMLSETEAWVEGIRVDPRVRGMGVATDLQTAELHWIAAHDGNVVRYMTAANNIGSQRLGAHHGLLEIGRLRKYGGSDRRDGAVPPPAAVAALSDVGKVPDSAWPRVRDDATLAAAHGLYQYRPWAFQELTEDRFRRHVARDEVLFFASEAGWAALIVNRSLFAAGEMHVACALGDGDALFDLLTSLGRPGIHLPDPDPPLLRGLAERFAAAGYVPADFVAIVVERRLDAADPLPDADDPNVLVLLDEPRRIAVPPVLAAD